MNAAPAFDIEIEPGLTYSVTVDGVVVEQFTADFGRTVGLAARGQHTAFLHEDGHPSPRPMKATIRHASPDWPHTAQGESERGSWADLLAAAPDGRYVLTCNDATFDLWLGPAAD